MTSGQLSGIFAINIMIKNQRTFCFSQTRVLVNDFKRFLFYCLYAFGIPVVFCIIVFLMDYSTIVSQDFHPLMGIERCWIQSGRVAEAIYVYAPMSIILFVNIILCSLTAFKIFKVQKKILRTKQKRESDDKKR